MKTLVLIDGHALAYRMYFALERTQMQTADGQPTWALHGFFNAIFQVLAMEQVDAIAFAFDAGRQNFRTERYSEYKAQRASMPDAMKAQMTALIEGVKALGFPLFQVAGVEADDVIGTLSHRIPQEHPQWRVDILTGDQDSFQLIDAEGRVNVLVPSRNPKEGLKRYDWQAVIDKWDVLPTQVIDCKGLKGDTSDNIPGVRGIGDKTAAKLLATYPTLEAVYANLNAIKPAGVQQKLREGEALAHLSKELATIKLDVPLELSLEACLLPALNAPAMQAFAQQWQLKQVERLVKAFAKQHQILLPETSEAEGNEATAEASDSPEALPLLGRIYPHYTHRIVSDAAEVEAFVAKILASPLGEAPLVAVDVETTGLDAYTAQPVGISFSWGDGLAVRSYPYENRLHLSLVPSAVEGLTITSTAVTQLENIYIPIAHNDLLVPQLPWEQLKPLIAPLIANPAVVKLIHNRKFEQQMFEQWGLPLQGSVVDTLLLSYVLESNRKHGLKLLASELIGIEMAGIDTLIGKGKKQITFDAVPVGEAAEYAAKDTYATWCLAHFLHHRLPSSLRPLLYELELPLAEVLGTLEAQGICLNTQQLATLSTQLEGELATLEADALASVADVLQGESLNLNSTKQLSDLLYKKLGLSTGAKSKKSTKSGEQSTDAAALEALAGQHPIIPLIGEYRQRQKLKSTYIDALPALLNPVTGRLHTHFNQTITATGRLSSSDPNLQNIPIRTPLGEAIRAAFIPQAGWTLISADYSQIELRVLAHICQDPALLDAFRSGLDIHQQTASLVFGVPADEVSKAMRYQAKTVNFGVVYGQGAHGLSQQLGISRGEAKAFIDSYFEAYPGIQTWIERCKKDAKLLGYSETLYGRQRNLRVDFGSTLPQMRQFAERASFNSVIQGSAAELIKLAMIRLHQALRDKGLQAKLLLQVHDELVLEAPPEELDATLATLRWAMELDQPLAVPLVVDVATGSSWLEG